MKKIIAVTILSVAASAPAAAENFYAGIKAGSTKHRIATSGYEETTGAFSIFGGYSFNQNFAAEIEAVGLGSLVSGSTTISAASLSVVGSIPLTEQASVFGKLGIAATTEKYNNSTSSDRTTATVGLGGQYDVTPTVGIRLGWDNYTYGGSNSFYEGKANMYSVGALIKF